MMTDLINTAEQSFARLILLRGASRLNGLKKSLRRQSHHPVHQTQQERHDQLEHTHTHTQVQSEESKRGAVRRKKKDFLCACYPLILFVRRRLSRRQQVRDSGDQYLRKIKPDRQNVFFKSFKPQGSYDGTVLD